MSGAMARSEFCVTSRGRQVAWFVEYAEAVISLGMLARMLGEPVQMRVYTGNKAPLPFALPLGTEAVSISETWTTFCAKP